MSAGRIGLGYAVIALLWIAFSDAAVTYLKLPPILNTIKGTVFVVVTASLLYFTIRRLVQAVQRSSQEREETAELYRTVVEASNEGICLLDESGRISFLNGRLSAILDRPLAELQGKRLQDFIEEPFVLGQPGALQPETRECRLRKDSGASPWVLISRRPVLNDAGEVARLIVTVTDFSEGNRADTALRRSDAYVPAVPAGLLNPRGSKLAAWARYGLAILSIGAALGTGLLLQYLHFHVPGALLLFAVAVSSWYGGVGPAGLAAVLAIISYYYYFIEPVHTIYINRSEIPFFIMFVLFAALLAWFGVVRRRVEAGLQKQAYLLNLTHDSIFVMDMHGVIQYWNRGAEEQYGWPAEKALGKVVHDLLKTVFSRPLEEIKAELIRTGRWEGDLVHTKKDGSQLAVASRWSLQRDRHGAPFAILETNNDITDRKRAEEALSRLNRELRAISNCNQSLLRATDEQSLLEEICRIVCEEAGYRAAWVAYAEHDEAKSVRPAAWTGTEQGYLASLGITWAESEHGCGPTGTAIRTGKTCCIQDFATDPRLALWRESALQHDFRSAIALPLKDEHTDAFGSLTIYSAQPGAFTSEEIRLLEELAGDLAFGIVTVRSRAARERAEQEVALLSFALDNVREAAFLIDDTGHFRYVNEAGCRILGYTYVELLRMGVPDIDVEFPVGRWSDHWRDLQERRSLSFESRHRTRDGRTFPVEISANYFEYGGRAYNLALVRDITERKQAEEERRENAERFRAIADYTYDWENWIGIDGKLLWVNPAVERMTGYSVGECMVMADFPIPIVAEADREAFARETREAVQGSSRNDFEFRVRHKDGGLVWVAASWQPIYDSRGARLGHRSSMRDITERKKAEDAVRRSETYLAESQKLSHTGSFGFDVASNKYVYASEECRRIFEVDAEEGLPSREAVFRLIHPEDWGRVNEDFEKLLREKVDTSSEFRIVLPSGAVKHIHVIRHLVVNDGGEVVTILGTAIDVTERKRAEEEVRNTAAQWQATFDAVQDYVLLLDEDFRILRANRAASEFLKLPVSKIVGQHCHDLVHGTSTPPAECPLAKMRQSRRHEEAEVPAGREGPWFAVSVDPVFAPGGELTQVVHVARDITERKRAEEALRRTTAYLAETQRLTHTGTFVSDQTTRPLYWSEELFRTFGFDPRDGLPSREQPLERIHPEDLDKFRQAWDRAINVKVDSDVEYRIVLPDGTVKHLYGLGHPILNPDGEVVEIVGSTVDITERKRAEQERERLRQLEADLAHINRVSVLGELAASIAHEVNQPISGVVSNGSACLRWLARDVPDLEEAREAARRIVRDGKRAGEVIARIRALTRKAETPREKLDLNEIIREVLALVGDEAKRKSVIVRTHFADDLSPVSGDRVQLQQVLLNLAMNAIEAMSNVGERARELVMTTRNIDAEQVQVTVEDSGIGLDPSTISKIFDPFYTTKPGGMGMGLSVSRSILQTHGGRLWAAARDGPGTAFNFTLPRHQEERSDAAVARA